MKEYPTKSANAVIAGSYIEIAKYVAKTRAYCSMIDGMKAVYRRMLYASRNLDGKVKSNTVTSRCSEFHPHGESIYDVLVNMTCKYNAFPLYEGFGNFGGAGFGAAASRYTSVKLSEIARLMYLELVDYADYVEGDAGENEPTYLPSLIPYCLLAGSKGMTVGLPTPNIPSFNVMELIDYFKARLTESDYVYPSIDVGKAQIYANNSNDLSELYTTGLGRVEYHAILEYDDKLVKVSSFPPNTKLWNIRNKFEEGVVDFSDTTSNEGISYEYTLARPRKLSLDEYYKLFEKNSWSADSYRFYLEHDSKVYLCSLNSIATKSLEYLKKCAIRKFKKDKIDAQFKLQVLEAIAQLKLSDELSAISTRPSSYYKDLITSWGYSKEVANSAMSKSINYLTNSHDNEIVELRNNYEYITRMEDNPTEYLLSLYDKLKEMITPFYNSKTHSTYYGISKGE